MDADTSRLPLDVAAVEERLAARELSWPAPIIKATTGSTNDDLEELALQDAPEGTSVVADEQTAGRGRLGRAWVSPPGAGLWVSVLIRAGDQPKDRWAWLSLVAGLAARDALQEACGVRTELKWPNDVVAVAAACGGSEGPRKLGGILSHVVGSDAVVIGIGLNVAMRSADLPVARATSVLLEGGDLDRVALLTALLTALHERVAQWRAGDERIGDDYRHACTTIGRLVDVQMPDGQQVSGIVSGIDDEGHLLVSDGEASVRVTAGDVIHATI